MANFTERLHRGPSGICAACGQWVERLELDHVTPRFAGGAHDTANLQWLCSPCHDKKTGEEFHLRPNKGAFSKEGVAALRATGWNPRTGHPHTDESRALMSTSHRALLADPERVEELRRRGRAGAVARWGKRN